MTTDTDTEIVAEKPRYQSRYSDNWSITVSRQDWRGTPGILFEAFRTVDGVLVEQQIRLPLDAADALSDAFDALRYGPPVEVAA